MRSRSRKGPNPLTRTYESNGPDVKIRGTAQHIADKYQQLARDAQVSGDRVISENYNQHAEHYLRIIAAAQPQQKELHQSSSHGNRHENEANNSESSENVVSLDAAGAAEQVVIGLDTPQPFIDQAPGLVKDEKPVEGASSSTEGSETEAAAESSSDTEEETQRRRVRGTRGRGVRRTPPVVSEDEIAPEGEDKPERAPRRTPRARTPRGVRTTRSRTPRASRSTDTELPTIDVAPALEPSENSDS
ncbi:DUF4167 domain-containing protein [Flexibacterium corallicola]|uniref:DUF4167 domain-containing protein n=1 Tax=Flexibacterium corallicola TaxID=3037259 RepID=UPI00386217B0